MESPTDITDLIEIYGNMLGYIRQDAEVHDPSEHNDDDEYCPAKLYERGQAVYDNHRLWRLMRAAPELLAALQCLLLSVEHRTWATRSIRRATATDAGSRGKTLVPRSPKRSELMGGSESLPPFFLAALNPGTPPARAGEGSAVLLAIRRVGRRRMPIAGVDPSSRICRYGGRASMAREPDRSDLPSAGLEPEREKPRRRTAGKPAKSVDAKKVKATYYLSAESIRRVGIAATMEGEDKSAIIERLIHEHLRKWVVSCRGQRIDEASVEDVA